MVRIAERDTREDFNAHEIHFRETTVTISQNFAEAIHQIWTWMKKRMNLVLVEGVALSRHHSDVKQKAYVCGDAERIWDVSSQAVLGLVREYVPAILDKLPDDHCPSCGGIIKVFTNKNRVVQRMWGEFWQNKATMIEIERNQRIESMVDAMRVAQKKFKLILDPNVCYSDEAKKLPQYEKQVFLPELTLRLGTTWDVASRAYLEAVMQGLPEMLSCRTYCSRCHTRIVP